MSTFFFQHHGAKPDALITAANAIPRYLLWAEDLPDGTVTSWPSRYVSGNATLTGGVVTNSSGYNQRKALYLDGGDYINLDAILGTFQGSQERTIILALRLAVESTTRCLISDAQNSGVIGGMYKVSLDGSDFATVTKSASVSSPSSQIPEGVPILLTIRSNGNTVEIFQRKRKTDTTLLTESMAETGINHDQHTLFAHRFQSTVTQYTSGYLRLAVEFGVPLSNTNLDAVLDLIESSELEGYNCPTVEEPEVLLTNELGVTPHILLYSPDLTVGTSPTTLPNRGSGPDASNVSYPSSYASVVTSYNNIPTVRLRGNGYLNFSSSIDGGWGTYATAEVILIAIQYSGSGLNNRRFIDYESTDINVATAPQRVIEMFSDNIRSYHVVGDGTADQVTTTNTPVKYEARYCIAYSKDGSGNARLLVRSRSQTGGFTEVYATGTQATAIPTAIVGAYVGGVFRPVAGGHSAFNVGDLAMVSVSRNVSVGSQAALSSLIDLIESENGFNLSMGRRVNQLDSVPQSASLKVFYSGRLQTTVITTAVDDWSSSGADGLPIGAIAIANDRFDYGSVASNYINPSPGIAIPSGTGSLACMAIVSRKSGLSWTSGDTYNIASGNNTGSCAFYVTGGNIKILWNSTLLDSGYSVLGWTVGVDHTVAFDYNGTTIRFFVDNMSTPVGTINPGVARTTVRTLQIGSFNGGVGWQGYMRSLQYWVGADLTTSGDVQKASVSQWMQLLHIYAEGDSNTDGNVSIAPAGASVWWYQIQKLFETEGWTAEFTLNYAVSGSAWNNSTPIAPTPMISRGTTLDALVVANKINVLLVGSHSSNDFNFSGLSLATVQGHITTYVNARRAAGVYHRIFFVETIPQSRNSTNNTKINDLNAWLLTQVGTLIDGLIQLPLALKDSTDTTYFIFNNNVNVAEHYNATGNGLLSSTIVDFLKAHKWS